MKKNLLILLGMIVLVLVSGYFYLRVQPPGAESPTEKVALASFTNAKGELWSIPEGDYKFIVSSDRSFYPSFLWGEIVPLKVKVGDTQKLRVVVGDRVPIKSVVAEFETDTRKWTVPLRFVRIEARAPADIAALEARYTVDENKMLVINDDAAVAKALETGIIPSAQAQDDMVRYVFEGEWVVEDTHTKTYHTVFIAENERGERNTLVMAWSDPYCRIWGGGMTVGALQGNCSYSAGNEGWERSDGAAVSLNGYNMTLSGTAQFLANSISFASGGSIILGGGSVKIGPMYVGTDADGDLVPAITTPQTSGSRRYYTLFGPETDLGYQAPTAAESSIISTSGSLERWYSFIDGLIEKVFAVGPCPGHPSCPPETQNGWFNPTYVFSPDGSVAYAVTPSNSTQYLRAYTFGFSLPATGTSTPMASFEVTVRARVDSGSVQMSVFAGMPNAVQQIGSAATVSNTSLQDFVFGGPGDKEYAFPATTVTNPNFGIWLQAYDGNAGAIYVDYIKLRVYYKMGPGTGDLYDNVASDKYLGYGLAVGSRTGSDCASAGGTFVNIGGQNAICRFGSTIPVGWAQYLDWSETSSNSCGQIGRNSSPLYTFVPQAMAICNVLGCTTGSHSSSNTQREECSYSQTPNDNPCNSLRCYANFVYRGAY